jgi:hypothetical protein
MSPKSPMHWALEQGLEPNSEDSLLFYLTSFGPCFRTEPCNRHTYTSYMARQKSQEHFQSNCSAPGTIVDTDRAENKEQASGVSRSSQRPRH